MNPNQNAGGHDQGQPLSAAQIASQLLTTEPYKNFIRTDQINATNFPYPQKLLDSYRDGFKGLWDAVWKNPKGTALHNQALSKLAEATRKLQVARKEELNKQQQQRLAAHNQAQGNAGNNNNNNTMGTPQLNGQATPNPNAAAPRPTAPQTQNPNAKAHEGEPLPPDIQAQMDRYTWHLPLNMAENTPAAETFRKEATRRFGGEMVKQRRTAQALKECEAAMQQAKQAQDMGKDMSTLMASLNSKRVAYSRSMAEGRSFMDKLISVNKQHQHDRQQMAQNASMAGRQGSIGNGAPSQPQQSRPSTANQQPQGQQTQFPQQQPQQGQPQSQQQQPQQQQPQQQMHNFARQSLSNAAHPQLSGAHNGGNGDELPAVTYTPSQALAASRSQAQQNSAAAGGAGAAAGGAGAASTTPRGSQVPHLERAPIHGNVDTIIKPESMIPQGWKPQPPQPVTMAAARPTLSGSNNGPLGSMGAPAITKTDTFLLQGPGDRVLDKKKLDELVRQVCGADAGEGDALRPEVEESVLQLADEFVDNVVQSACKLAKLRGGTFLELRDIQLVLERNYNIRIPGYGTDEVRTVRKTQPAPGYFQKMQAVQAAKVTGGGRNDV